MRQAIIALLLSLLFIAPVKGQHNAFHPAAAIAMKPFSSPKVLKNDSRASPENIVQAFWELAAKDVQLLERNFKRIYHIKADSCCQPGAKVDSLHKFAFQYVGVIINTRKYIYINAFPLECWDDYRKRKFDLSEIYIIPNDGGVSCWGALFDIKTKTFSSLAFNGDPFRRSLEER